MFKRRSELEKFLAVAEAAWLEDDLSFLLHPEAALFANLPAWAVCAADYAAASAGLPQDPLFWCAGCQGGMYPLTGNVVDHVGGVQASLLAAQRLVYHLHRTGIAWGTSGNLPPDHGLLWIAESSTVRWSSRNGRRVPARPRGDEALASAANKLFRG